MIKLKEIRKQKGITQKKLAELTGLNKVNICRWENGNANPDNETILKIAKALNVTTDYLLGIDNQIAQNGDLTQEELKELEKYKEFLIYKRKK